MFGYVRPALQQLDPAQRELYQGAYCGLCHAMGRRHGFLARLTLQYDFTFLAILLAGEQPCTDCRRCPVHPFRKPRACLAGPGMDAAADESIILTWHKLQDDAADKGPIAGLPARFLSLIFRRAYRKAAAARPAFDAAVREHLTKLGALEAAQSPALDRVADTFASILSAAAAEHPGGPRMQRPLAQLLYHTGRWIYIADAWDDLAEDQRARRYNPLAARFPEGVSQQREYVETTMTHSVRLASSAANLMELGPWTPVVDNILTIGIPAVQSAVLDGRWREMQRNSGRSRKTDKGGLTHAESL